ncbi:unannotated protein [freshwater metagenome]|uniref:Unannotated protein n=1 Tax=freshwater metagenome TaxID=449393 RepID=A0A6J7F7I2_9ZZZZ
MFWRVISMTKRSSFLRYGLRSAAGLVGAGIAAAVVGFLCIVPLPGFTATARSELITPTPADQRLICPGGLVDVMTMAGDATSFAAVGVPEYVTAAQDTEITQTALQAPDNAMGNDLAAPQQIFAPAPTADVTPRIAGSQSQQPATENVAGLAVTACVEAATDSWLVGGSTETGRTTLLFLSNPTLVAANVTIAVLSEKGPITGPGSSGILVEPSSQRIISLASLAPNASNPVVHVTSTGGQVVATLQQSVVRTLLPDGVELVAPGAAPNVRLVIPGVRLSGMSAQHANEGGMITSDLQPAIRVGVPGVKDAVVTVTAFGVSGDPVVVKSKVPAGRVVELPFGNLEDGIYSLVVSSTQPVVAAARAMNDASIDPFATSTAAPTPLGSATPKPTAKPTSQPTTSRTPGALSGFDGRTSALAAFDDIGGDAPAVNPGGGSPSDGGAGSPSGSDAVGVGGDFTWSVATMPVLGDTLITVTSAPHPTLTLFNAGEASITVGISQEGTSLSDVTVPANGMRTVPLVAGARYVMTSTAQLYASVSYAAQGLGANMPLSPASPLGSGVIIYPR